MCLEVKQDTLYEFAGDTDKIWVLLKKLWHRLFSNLSTPQAAAPCVFILS